MRIRAWVGDVKVGRARSTSLTSRWDGKTATAFISRLSWVGLTARLECVAPLQMPAPGAGGDARSAACRSNVCSVREGRVGRIDALRKEAINRYRSRTSDHEAYEERDVEELRPPEQVVQPVEVGPERSNDRHDHRPDEGDRGEACREANEHKRAAHKFHAGDERGLDLREGDLQLGEVLDEMVETVELAPACVDEHEADDEPSKERRHEIQSLEDIQREAAEHEKEVLHDGSFRGLARARIIAVRDGGRLHGRVLDDVLGEEEIKRPVNHHAELFLRARELREVDRSPHPPRQKAGEAQAEDLRDARAAPDCCEL